MRFNGVLMGFNQQNLQETSIFSGKKLWFPVDFPLNQSNDIKFHYPLVMTNVAIENYHNRNSGFSQL